MDILVGVDAGTSVVKAIAITPAGSERALATRSLSTTHPEPRWAQQNMHTVWEQAAGCLGDLPTFNISTVSTGESAGFRRRFPNVSYAIPPRRKRRGFPR